MCPNRKVLQFFQCCQAHTLADLKMEGSPELLRMTSQAFSPSRLGILILFAGGCSHLTLGIMMRHEGEGSPFGT